MEHEPITDVFSLRPRRKIHCVMPKIPVFFISLYWFFGAYIVANIILFLRWNDTAHTLSNFIKQTLFINITSNINDLLIVYALLLVVVGSLSLLVIHFRSLQVALLVSGITVGIILGIFCYAMSIYLSSLPCETVGCSDVEYKIFGVNLIYIVYGLFIAPLIPIVASLYQEPCDVNEFLQKALIPGLCSIAFYFIMGMIVAFSVVT